MAWDFYGRQRELDEMTTILGRRRWFFARVTGRRRIGKTTLVQRALGSLDDASVFYAQIPDSGPAGVLSAIADAMDTFELDAALFPRPKSLLDLAQTVRTLVQAGTIVALDEFQYFSRKHLFEFTSHLQAVVDELAAKPNSVTGGLLVLGSIHSELVALLEDRNAPLYNRTTDHIELDHLDTPSVVSILRAHGDMSPERLLFFWNLFEGVPKFYRDCYEQGVLDKERASVIAKMFFKSSSPLRSEADNWFLHELRGRYDVVLKFVARHPGCSNGDVLAHVRDVSPDAEEQISGYLNVLIEKYRMLERKNPIFARPLARRGRFYVRDNFLRSWLAALQNPVSAISFRPETQLVAQADERLAEAEGHGLERLVAQLYEERSRAGVGDFRLTNRIEGYWDRSDTEIDLVAVDEDSKTIRFGTCKRNPSKLLADLADFEGHVERFLGAHEKYRSWIVEKVAVAPSLSKAERMAVEGRGMKPQDLNELVRDLNDG